MANVLFFLSLLVVLVLIWFDSEKKRDQGKKKRHSNRINALRKPRDDQAGGMSNESYAAHPTLNQTIKQTFFGAPSGGKTAKIDDRSTIKPQLIQKMNKTEIKNDVFLAKKETKQNATIQNTKQARTDQKLSKSLPKKAPKYSFIIIKLLTNLLSNLIWLSLKSLFFLFSLICRLIAILRLMRNSFLSKLVVFYLTVLSILSALTICTTATLKEFSLLTRLGHHLGQLHLQILRTTVNAIKTFLTFLLLLVAILYPAKYEFKFESSNYFNHLKLIWTGLVQTILLYLSKLLGYSIFYLTKFEIYFGYLESYFELLFPSNVDFR